MKYDSCVTRQGSVAFLCVQLLLPQSAFSHGMSIASLPPEVLEKIRKAPVEGNIYSVNDYAQEYSKQILKADTITFHENSNLVLSNINEPWVAIVAKNLQFTEPDRPNKIIYRAAWTPQVYQRPAQPATPGAPVKAPVGANGTDGTSGNGGATGSNGDTPPRTPDVYLIVGNIVNKLNKPVPQSLYLVFDMRGMNGGDAGPGGVGGNGGPGGDGGDGDYHSPDRYPLSPGCVASAGRGGAGGIGGLGGTGGIGAPGANGAALYYAAPQNVLYSLSYAQVFNQPGVGGAGGLSGTSGVTGPDGARGAHPGTCRGGTFGPARRNTPATAVVRADKGKEGTRGAIFTVTYPDLSSLFTTAN